MLILNIRHLFALQSYFGIPSCLSILFIYQFILFI